MGGASMMSYFDDNILKIGYGDCDTCITAIDMEFDGLFEYDWLQNDMNKRILREIDNAIEGPLGIVDLDDPTRMFKIYDKRKKWLYNKHIIYLGKNRSIL